jgi:hypothetical protein
MMTRVKPLFYSLVLAGLVLLTGCAGVLELDEALAVAPYRIDVNGRIVVDSYIDGRGPFEFVLDTGSSISAAFDQVRKTLDLELVPRKRVIVHGAVASGRFPLLALKSLELGGSTWSDPRVVLLPGTSEASIGNDGILGLDFLRRYAIGFAPRERIVRLYRPETVAERAYRGWASVPFSPRSFGDSGATLYFIDVQIDGWDVPAVFDLGAGLNMINWPGARSLGIRKERLRSDQLLSGVLQSDKLMARLDANVVRTAGIRWHNEYFSIADLEIFAIFGLADRPAAILGAGLFTQREFVIDFARGRLLINVSNGEVDFNED